jgi:phosphoglycolate phosphatase-like HAD superfamily hydrolase
MQLAEIHPVRSLFFDLDGTLIDSCPGIAAALALAFRAAGRTMPAADLRAVVGPPIRIIATRIDPTLTDAELAQIETVYRAEYDSDGWRDTVLFSGVVPVLQDLCTAGARLFLVTNKPRIPTAQILKHFGISEIFDDVVTRDSRTPGYAGKAEMLSEMLIRHSLAPESTIMIGDTAEDEEAAMLNRLEFIHAAYGYGSCADARRSIACFLDLRATLSQKNIERL